MPKKDLDKDLEQGREDAIINEKLSSEILGSLRSVDIHKYVYEQCRSAAGRGLGVEEENLLEKSRLILPAHWEVNGRKAESAGTKVGAASHDRDYYYDVNVSELTSEKDKTFKLKHKSLSGNTDIDFLIETDTETGNLLIVDVDAYKASPNTLNSVESIASKEGKGEDQSK